VGFLVDKEVLKQLSVCPSVSFTPTISHCTSARRSCGWTDSRTTLVSHRTLGTNNKREDKNVGNL